MGGRLKVIKLVLKGDIMHTISAHAPQPRFDESVKNKFGRRWRKNSTSKKIFMAEDLNGH